MPRQKKPKNEDASGEASDSDVLWPELDDSPEHKALIKAAKILKKARAERENVLKTSKANVDGKQDRLIALMHESKLTKFRHDGIVCEIIAGKEKAEVKVEGDDTDDSEDD